MIEIQDLQWRTLAPTEALPQQVANWLIDTQSLTAKLKAKYIDFQVRVIDQSEQAPYANERASLPNTANTVVREVELMGGGQSVVFARSVIPITSDTQAILQIGAKPLGETLFNDPSIVRGELQVARSGEIWGRRSTFTLGQTPILVSEFFLEALYA